MVSKKNQSVETLRGVAIVLVVIGHVIGIDKLGGMKVDENSFWRHFYYTFEYLRMPLFTVISGWVYALRPTKKDEFLSFNLKKIRRLLLPMIFVGISYFMLQYIVPGTNSKGNLIDVWKIFVFPYTLFWYLPSLFWVFLFAAFLDSYNLIDKIRTWVIVLFFAFALMSFRDYLIPESAPNYFSYKGAIYLLPYFFLGIGIQRFKDIFSSRILNQILLLVLIVGVTIQQLVWYDIIDVFMGKRGGIGLLIGIAGTVLLYRIKWKINWLIYLGSYAYSIYLFHAFGTAGGRILIKTLGISSEVLIFSVSLFVGIGFPIIAEMILDRFKVTRVLFLGRSYKK